ncbi:MAG: dicarboxylate/amino acid:cation symporter [Firmicutes bacterium]|nr:dicarboxylate/amino acid:cation symporter [Bacillota bacterium]MCM1401160.1 dicarboxylate/amino acid:cation symporter [Bacteroides sp.]MCM1477017.1 dicarboxylate/amino acid:cation symporter [Bacteroides sp.]
MMNRKIHIGLLGRILIGMCLGVGAGFIAPDWVGNLMATFNYVFSQFLGFLIPLIIVGFVTPAIADIGSKAGKMLIVTAAIAYFATLLAGFTSFLTADTVFPTLLHGQVMPGEATSTSAASSPYFTIDIPSLMPVTTALVFAFMLGLGCAYIKGVTLRNVLYDLRDVVSLTINKAVIPLLPIYICGIFMSMTMEGKVVAILTAFSKIILIIFLLHIGILLFQYCVAAIFFRRNPLKMLWIMLPAYFTALGTQSSAATIPVTLRRAILMGVNEEIAGFVVPLCATIHMSGSTLKIVACAIALMILQGIPYDVGVVSQFIAMLGITIIAAPGIPGGAIMASLGLLSSILGFSDAQNAMMIALYIAMDSFGTACNVTGDGAIAAIVDRIFRKEIKKPAADAINN